MYEIAHIAIVVKDIEVSSDFYQKVLKCKVIGSNENERLRFLYLKCGVNTIELLQYKKDDIHRGRGIIDHLAFNVENLDLEIKRLKDLKVHLEFEEPKDANGMKIIFFNGPDGERMEFME